MSRRKYAMPYTKEFREQVVKMAQGSECLPREIAEKFGISPDSVLRWVKQADPDAVRRPDGLTRSERQRLARPRCEDEGFADLCLTSWLALRSPTGRKAQKHSGRIPC